jgi:hypothetical protein
MSPWGLFSPARAGTFRAALAVDDATGAVAAGHCPALIFIPYYLDTNPVGVDNARHAIDEVLVIMLQTMEWACDMVVF